MKKLTIREIADNLGVSPATVSIVLNDKEGVSAETRARVKSYLIETNYTFPKDRRKNAFGNVFLLKYAEHGLIVEENQGFIAAIIDQIEKDFKLQNVNLTMVNCNKGNLVAELARVSVQNPNGIILIGTEIDASLLKIVTESKLPMTVVDHSMRYQNKDSVVMDNVSIAFGAVKHLVKLGHQRIGHIKSNILISNFAERQIGFDDAMKSFNLETAQTISLKPTLEGSYQDMRTFLQSGNKIQATAFFADNDSLAIGAIRALQENGIHVPKDVSMIGVDDIPFSAINNPPLTTMRISRSEMGHLAVENLNRRLKNPNSPTIHVLLSGTLIPRKSTAEFREFDR